MRPLTIIGAVDAFAMLLDAWFYAHYRRAYRWLDIRALIARDCAICACGGAGAGQGLLLARAIPAICELMILVRLAAQPVRHAASTRVADDVVSHDRDGNDRAGRAC